MRSTRLLAVSAAAFAVFCLSVGIAESQDKGTAQAGSAEKGETPRAEVVRELLGQRTATSKTFRLSNGQLQTHIFTTPINYLGPDGGWRRIDNRLEQKLQGSISNRANAFNLELPKRIGGGLTRLAMGKRWVSSRLIGEETQPAVLSGETATYKTVNAGTTFRLLSTVRGVKESIVLADRFQPHTFEFELNASDGVEPRLLDAGSVVFRHFDGQAVAVIPAPTVFDDSPDALPNGDAVNFELVNSPHGNWILRVEVDSAWLSSPARKWPVVIDPSIEAPKAHLSVDCQYFKREPSGETNVPASACGSTGAGTLKAEYTKSGGVTVKSRVVV